MKCKRIRSVICRLKFFSDWKYLTSFILLNKQGAVHNIFHSKYVSVTTGSSLHFYNTISIWHVAGSLDLKKKGLYLNTQLSRFLPNIDIKNKESRDAALYNDIIFITCFCLRPYGVVYRCWLTLLKDPCETKTSCIILDCLFSTMQLVFLI